MFADGSKGEADHDAVRQVRHVLSTQAHFDHIEIIYRNRNIGLALNIESGLDLIFETHDAAIVLEDDILLNENAIEYFLAALKCYRYDADVYHINGWRHPNLPDVSECGLTRFMSCWGWATWKDQWGYSREEIREKLNKMTLAQKYRFDRGGSGYFWIQLLRNFNQGSQTWAIFWYSKNMVTSRFMC